MFVTSTMEKWFAAPNGAVSYSKKVFVICPGSPWFGHLPSIHLPGTQTPLKPKGKLFSN